MLHSPNSQHSDGYTDQACLPALSPTVHEVEPDPLPAVEFTYQKFLTPGKNYTPAIPTAPMVGASQAFRSRPAGYCGFFEPEFFLFFF